MNKAKYLAIKKKNLFSIVNLYIIILFFSNFNLFCCPGINEQNQEGQEAMIDIQDDNEDEKDQSESEKDRTADGDIQYPEYPDFIISLQNETYFNNIIKFDKKKYQVGNFATNKNGDLILEVYENTETSSSRLFYGLTKEGRYLFSNEFSCTLEKIIESSSNNQRTIDLNGKRNSFNLFVSIQNKENEYLFSFNSYNSWIEVELFDLNSDYNEYYKWDFQTFFDYGENINNYELILLESKSDLFYFIVFIPNFIVTYNMSGRKFIKKFNFKSFGTDAYNENNIINYEDYLNYKIIDVFFMYDSEILVVFYAKEGTKDKVEEEEANFLDFIAPDENQVQARRIEIYQQYNIKLYDKELQMLNCLNEIQFPFIGIQLFYFKSIYLRNRYTILSYVFHSFIYFYLIQIDTDNNIVNIMDSAEELVYYFGTEILSDFVKIGNNRVIFIYTGGFIDNNLNRINLLSIIFIDIEPFSFILSTNIHYINMENLIPILQLSAFAYNGHLLLAPTVIKEEDLNLEESEEYFSLLIMFGYSNGTDSIIDISYYLNDNENYGINDKEFIDILYENFNIENNIFNYVSANKIKVVFIPQEIEMLNERTGELINIDSEIYLDNNYYFKQNFNLPKTSQYYYIDYQYIIKEQNENEENERIFYGKTNRLKFKLCFEYCDTCNELGLSEKEQKCLSCLDDYQYNYDYYNNKIINNCVPEGYYYDNEINSLILCDSIENIKYITIDNNKRICYKDLFNNAESSNIININENINENEISKYESKSDKRK